MGILNFIKPKCAICGERERGIDSVGGYGIYKDEKIYFHRSCLRDITCDPEHYKHTQVDTALFIIETLQEEKNNAIIRKNKNKEKCKQLSNFCIDEKELF